MSVTPEAVTFDFELLAELTEESGVPGYEDRIREVVRRELGRHTDHVRSDAMGNVVGTLEGDAEYTVAVAAHMDERNEFIGRIPLGGPKHRYTSIENEPTWTARVALPRT